MPANSLQRTPPTEHLKPYQWKKGQSGNPSGRSPNLVNEIKRLTDNGIEMAHVMIQIMRGQEIEGIKGDITYKDVKESATWLAERVFGKAPISLISEEGDVDLLKVIYMELQKSPYDKGKFDLKDDHIIETKIEKDD